MTTPLGFDKPLYILSFDYRSPLLTTLASENMTADHAAEVASTVSEIVTAKRFVYDGFKAALAAGVPNDKAGILVDEQFGARILGEAAEKGYLTACPAEKNGQEEFDFEYGENFANHIEAFHPTFCKVLVRYDPEGNEELNRRQSTRLKRLSEYLHGTSRSLFMLDLLLPRQRTQLQKLESDEKASLTVGAMQQLQDAQVEPDVWGVEGLERREEYERVVAAARRGGRDRVGCIILGEADDDKKVRESLSTAASVPGFIGFAVGRTIFWQPVSQWLARQIAPKAAVAEIAQHYRQFVNIFERDRYEKAG